MRLSDVLHEEDVPEKVYAAVSTAMEAWNEEQNSVETIGPPVDHPDHDSADDTRYSELPI